MSVAENAGAQMLTRVLIGNVVELALEVSALRAD
jgi:hypothetical protein